MTLFAPTPAANASHGAPGAASGPTVATDMADYYAQRAAYYERVYHKPERQADLRAIEAWLPGVFKDRRVLEVACGTGWWTPHGARDCTHWLATDLNEETMALARTKQLPAGRVDFAAVDAFRMDEALGDRRFNAAFAGCWWSHLRLSQLPGWIDHLHARLEPGSRVVFLDNSFVQTSSLPIHRRDDEGNTYQLRTLDDGSTHEVVKNFPAQDEAFAALGPRAREPRWIAWTHYWVLDYTLA